ncbi:MAG: hypothetical protein HS114_34850 [Anaerolineales bacterium]|nr:hypothetical protein [Anaerolineales bacterium]
MYLYHSKPHKFLKPGQPDLERAWLALPGGPDALHHNEVWQYMGTWYSGGRWVHQFRHRCHPHTGQRSVLNVPAGWFTSAWLTFTQRFAPSCLANISACWRFISASLRRSTSAWAASSSMILKHKRRMWGWSIRLPGKGKTRRRSHS